MAKPSNLLDDFEDGVIDPDEFARWELRDLVLQSAYYSGLITELQYWWATTSDDTPDN